MFVGQYLKGNNMAPIKSIIFLNLFIEYLYRVFTLHKIYTKIKFLLSTWALAIKDKILKALKEK